MERNQGRRRRRSKRRIIRIMKILYVYHEIVMIMHVYHALINALSSHMIHINLNTIFCPHEEKCPTNAIYM